MPISTTRDNARGFTEHLVGGRVTTEEVLTCQTTFYEAGPTRLLPWDLSAADLTQLTTENMRQFVRRTVALSRERQGGRRLLHLLLYNMVSGEWPKLSGRWS